MLTATSKAKKLSPFVRVRNCDEAVRHDHDAGQQTREQTTIGFQPGEYVIGTRPPIRHPTSQVITVAAARR